MGWIQYYNLTHSLMTYGSEQYSPLFSTLDYKQCFPVCSQGGESLQLVPDEEELQFDLATETGFHFSIRELEIRTAKRNRKQQGPNYPLKELQGQGYQILDPQILMEDLFHCLTVPWAAAQSM